MTDARRKNTRLKSWDYAGNAWYFVTICCANRAKLFGDVVDAEGVPVSAASDLESISLSKCTVALSPMGECCDRVFSALRSPRKQVSIGEYVIMPNHVHLVVKAHQGEGVPTSLESFIHFAKAAVTREIRKSNPRMTVWQKGYYEHIIRDDADYLRIVEYIANNPAKWVDDRYFS